MKRARGLNWLKTSFFGLAQLKEKFLHQLKKIKFVLCFHQTQNKRFNLKINSKLMFFSFLLIYISAVILHNSDVELFSLYNLGISLLSKLKRL